LAGSEARNVKLTWFGGTTLRVQLGGKIVVVDADGAPDGIDRAELVSGADRVVQIGEGAFVDPAGWRPKASRGIDAESPLEVIRIGPAALLVAIAGEPHLVVFGSADPPRFGRWADGAVVVLTSGRENFVAEASVLLDVARPRLVAIAADEQTLDLAIEELSEHLDGAGLISLEPGLAVEV
jgi:hypothetical protein